jgi:septal ring factor EnvC (AmiA/AmiB activator)
LVLVVAVLLVRRRIARARSAAAPTDPEVRPNVRAWLAAGPGHARALQHVVREHPQLRARAEAAERELAPLRDRIARAEEQAEQLRQDLSQRDDQLKALRKDWEDVTQRVSQVLLELLEKRHDEH